MPIIKARVKIRPDPVMIITNRVYVLCLKLPALVFVFVVFVFESVIPESSVRGVKLLDIAAKRA